VDVDRKWFKPRFVSSPGKWNVCNLTQRKRESSKEFSIACVGKIAASVLLKLFISAYERCHTTDVCAEPGVAKSQKCILVHGPLIVKQHLSVPRHYLPVHK